MQDTGYQKQDKVVYGLDEILDVWKVHFSALSTPKNDPAYDCDHFDFINRKVERLNGGEDDSVFTETPISTSEVQKAMDKLKRNKSCG